MGSCLREHYYKINIEVEDVSDIARLVGTLTLGLKTLPSPIIVSEREGNFVYIYPLPLYFLSGKRDIFIIFCKSDKEPKNYIRYVDAPKETIDFRNNTKNPTGIYIPIINAATLPRILDPNVSDIQIKNAGKEIILDDNLPEIKEFPITIYLEEENFFRLCLERKEMLKLVFRIKSTNSNNMAIYFSFGEPMRIGEKLYGRIFYTRRKNTELPFLTIDDRGRLVETKGKKQAALPYLSLIRVRNITEKFIQIFV